MKKESIKELLAMAFPKPPKSEVDEMKRQVWARISGELDKRDNSLRSLYGDGWTVEPLNQLDLQVVTAVYRLGAGATLVEITDKVNEWSAQKVMIGTVMARLADLEKREILATGPLVTEYGESCLKRAQLENKHVEETAGNFGDGRSFETSR